MSALAQMLDANHHVLRELGWKLLQPYRYGETDEAHAQYLLEIARFPVGARVLDVGCGVGECARLMHEIRPDLRFTLLNFSAEQLKDCPATFEQVLADAHAIPYLPGAFDAVMFNHALGNMHIGQAFAEAVMVLRTGGVMLVNEIERTAGDGAHMHKMLAYEAIDGKSFERLAAEFGLVDCVHTTPAVTHEYLRAHWPHPELDYDQIFAGTRAAVWRFVKASPC